MDEEKIKIKWMTVSLGSSLASEEFVYLLTCGELSCEGYESILT